VAAANLAPSQNAQNHNGGQKGGEEKVTVSTAEPLKVQADVPKDWRDKLNWFLTAILVAIGGLGVLYARSTLKVINAQLTEIVAAGKQTDKMVAHAGKQAEASSLSVQAFIQSERAWVMETIKFPNEIPRRTPPNLGIILSVVFNIENVGKQPALIRNIQTRFHTYRRRLPDEPEYVPMSYAPDVRIGPYGRLLIPGKPWAIETFLEDGLLEDATVDGINEGWEYLYVYGRITYDSAGLKCVNQFCYTWNPLRGLSFEGDKPGFRKDGPAEYNKHT